MRDEWSLQIFIQISRVKYSIKMLVLSSLKIFGGEQSHRPHGRSPCRPGPPGPARNAAAESAGALQSEGAEAAPRRRFGRAGKFDRARSRLYRSRVLLLKKH